jgi:hypothetical protein
VSSTPFDEEEAAKKLGFPGEKFDSIVQYRMDGLYWVNIGTGTNKIGRPVIVENGHVVADKGYAVGMAWLRRVATVEQPAPALNVIPQVLRWYDSLPIGWSEADAADRKTGGVTLQPKIEVKLVSATYIPPRSRKNPDSGPPPGLLRPPSGPGGGPPGGGPPGGGGPAPQRESRATLLEVNGKLTWVIESLDPWTKQWKEDFREQAEP